MMDTKERRSFFRIQDDLVLDYRTVDDYTANNEECDALFPDSAIMSLFAGFRRIDNEAAQSLHSISEQNRHIADYLSSMNRKIDLLAHQLLADKHPLPEIRTQTVSLSEGGIGFICDKPIYKGSYIALQLVFLPAYVGIVVFAQVIRCEQKKGGYTIAAKFHRMSEQREQLLSKQIIQSQLKAKREKQTMTAKASN